MHYFASHLSLVKKPHIASSKFHSLVQFLHLGTTPHFYVPLKSDIHRVQCIVNKKRQSCVYFSLQLFRKYWLYNSLSKAAIYYCMLTMDHTGWSGRKLYSSNEYFALHASGSNNILKQLNLLQKLSIKPVNSKIVYIIIWTLSTSSYIHTSKNLQRSSFPRLYSLK